MKTEDLILKLELDENYLVFMLDKLYKEQIAFMLKVMGDIVIDLENEDIINELPYSPQILDFGNNYVYYRKIELVNIYPYIILENDDRMPLSNVGHKELRELYNNVKYKYLQFKNS